MNNSYFLQKRLKKGLVYAVLILGALYTLAPLWFLFVNSFKGQSDIINKPLALPNSFDLQYVLNAAKEIHFFKAIGITLGITTAAVALIVLVASMAAWMLVRTKTKLSGFIFMMFVAAMLIPFQAVMYPLIQFFDTIGLKNLPGLIFMYGGFGMSMSIFLYHGFAKGVPLGVEEAAFIDGCGVYQMFFMIVMPLLKSISVTVIILNAMWVWNDYLLPFLVIGNSANKTLVLELYFARILAGQYGNPWQLIFPSVFITTIPVIIVFLFLQKYIVSGISDGAIKA